VNLDHYRLTVAFATAGEPSAHGACQAFRLDAETGFEQTVGDRERVIELSLPGEVAHTEIIEPIERTGAALGPGNEVDAQFSGVHRASIT